MVIRGIDELCSQMLNVAIGWYVYSATHNPISLAYLGLARFLPNIGMVLVTGHAGGSSRSPQNYRPFAFLTGSLHGCIRCLVCLCGTLNLAGVFPPPGHRCGTSLLLPRHVGNAAALGQLRRISARRRCGFVGVADLCARGSGRWWFALCAQRSRHVFVFRVTLSRRLDASAASSPKNAARLAPRKRPIDASPLGGIRYIRSNRLLFSIISLDLFAVLLGGVTALLPIFAKDVLAVGPAGLGCLRCAPGVGAAIVGLVLAHRTIQRGAGKRMLLCVAGFGFATIVFALSRNMWLSLVALIAAGGFDMVSMVIRQTLVQVSTPDAMRGRVSAVQWMFVRSLQRIR
jgi:Bacterial protein of unknown function (DUF894).